MSDQAKAVAPQAKQEKQEKQAGFCSATCMDQTCVQKAIAKPIDKTSDFCHLPNTLEHPHWFNGYGSQVNREHPLYRTTSGEYGWYPPGIHSVPTAFYPATIRFAERLYFTGMYRRCSLNSTH